MILCVRQNGGIKRIVLSFAVILLLHVAFLYHYNTIFNKWIWSNYRSATSKRYHYSVENRSDSPISSFNRHWKDWNRWRFDYKRYVQPCSDSSDSSMPGFKWTKAEDGKPWFERPDHTDPTRGVVQEMEIGRAGEFSRFSLRSQNSKGEFKHTGGDHWRVQIKGPSSSSLVSVQKIDHANGTYEFKFIVYMSGSYEVLIWLEYTLCAGLKEPPPDWFKKGM